MKNTTNTAIPEGAPVIYSINDVMAILHLGRSSVYKLFGTDGFPAIKLGGSFRVEKTAFEKWLNTYAGKSFIL